MKLPRDAGGEELAALLSRYGFQITRLTGSHIRLTSTYKGSEHHITIPHHKHLKTGTISNIINDIAIYLEIDKQELIKTLFE